MAQQKWVNKSAIMTDLSLTQGNVMIDNNETIGITEDDKPPAYLIVEETEEKYFGDCVGDGITREPDYVAIQEYLSLVNNIGGDIEENEQDKYEKGLQNSTKLKLNPHATLFTNLQNERLPATDINDNKLSQKDAKILTEELKCTINTAPNKGRKERNVAIASILKVYAGVAPIQTKCSNPISSVNKEVKLLKPMDFMPEQNTLIDFTPPNVDNETRIPESSIPQDSIQKVSEWMNGDTKLAPVLYSTNMFRRKAVTTAVTPPSIPSTKASSPKETNNGYKPSGVADAFYKKFKANCEIREALNEDIWSRAQKDMRALDRKKQERKDNEELARIALEMEQRDKEASSSMTNDKHMSKTQEVSDNQVKIELDNGVEMTLPASICLPQHRHLLTGDCEVCKVLCDKELPSLPDEQ